MEPSSSLVSKFGPDLPDGLLEDIFNHLSGSDLKAARLVCKRWNNIIIIWTFQHKTCFEFHGKTKLARTSWKHHLTPKYVRNAKLARILTRYLIPQQFNEEAGGEFGSVTGLVSNTALVRPWPSLRFKKVSSQQLKSMVRAWNEHTAKSTAAASSNAPRRARARKGVPSLATTAACPSEISVFKNPTQKQLPVLQHVLGHVTKLELVTCTITVPALLKFLSWFKNLRKLIDDNCKYEYFRWEQLCDDMDLEGVLEPFQERRINRACLGRSFPSIKSVVIKKPGAYKDMLQILLMFELTLADLEEFVLYFSEEDRYPFFNMDYPTRLGLFLLRHAKTLQRIEFNWWHTYYELYFEDCLQTLQIFATTTAPLLVTELVLSVQWIFILRDDFQRIFIPLVHRLRHLKKLFLAKVMFEPTARTIQVLKELIRQPPEEDEGPGPSSLAIALHAHETHAHNRSRSRSDRGRDPPLRSNLDFTFGVFVCDPTNEDRIMNTSTNIFDPRRILLNNQLLRITRDLLKDPIMKTSMVSLHLAFDLSFVSCAEQLLPLNPVPEVYDKVKELNITSTRSASFSKQFSDYHIDILVKSFPNLTKLGIFDGPQFLYANKNPELYDNQWNNMSNACIGGEQIQTIIRSLPKMKSLRLRVNFKLLRDAGLTGIKSGVCQELHEHAGSTPVPMPTNNNMPSTSKAAIENANAAQISSFTVAHHNHNDRERIHGVSFSHLPALEELMLKGLPRTITDVTAFNAFNNCRNLKQLTLCGQFQFTKEGEDYLKALSIKNNFKLQLNSP